MDKIQTKKLAKQYSRMSDREISAAVNRHLNEYEPEARDVLVSEYQKRQHAANMGKESDSVETVYAGQVYRFFAFCIDGVLLWVVGYVVAAFAMNWLCDLTWEAMLIGMFISLFYFAVLESRINNGQSVGKILMKIRVVNQNGSPQTFVQSALRASIIVVPYQLKGFPIAADAVVSGILFIAVLGFIVSQIYLAFFNTSNRQLLHDMAARTVVIKARATLSEAVSTGRTYKKGCLVIFGIVAVFVTLVSLRSNVTSSEQMDKLSSLQKSISAFEGVMMVSVHQNVTNGIHRSLSINVRTRGYVSEPYRIVRDISNLIIRTSEFEGEDIVIVNIGKSVDIGIARKSDEKIYSFNPAKLKEQMNAITAPNRISSSARPR